MLLFKKIYTERENLKEKYTILIVEDEAIASHYLNQLLLSLGDHTIFKATNARDAFGLMDSVKFDFAFLDINIDGVIDGIECAKIMNEKYFLPIIFTTAYNDTQTMQEASMTNMFGYLMKPFEQKDVEAALHIALNRIRMTTTPKEQIYNEKEEIQLGENQRFSFKSQTFFIKDQPINLTKKEIAVLCILAININQNISFEIIKECVWENKEISNATIRDTIRRIRVKSPELKIQSVAGFGYSLRNS